MIEPGGHLARDVLLGVLGPDRGEQTLERGDVTRGRRREDPVVKAIRYAVSVPPPEFPVQPSRLASTSGRLAR